LTIWSSSAANREPLGGADGALPSASLLNAYEFPGLDGFFVSALFGGLGIRKRAVRLSNAELDALLKFTNRTSYVGADRTLDDDGRYAPGKRGEEDSGVRFARHLK
jgi:hypothetical protein